MFNDNIIDASRPSGPLVARDNHNSTVMQAGGDIHLYERETLPTRGIPDRDMSAARDAWVEVGETRKVVETLRGTGLAVVAGRPGTGRYAHALRALVEISEEKKRDGQSDLTIQNVAPDWDEPNISLLPSHSGHGYILNVSQTIDQWQNASEQASGFLSFAEKLRKKGSYLVLLSSDHGWPRETGAQAHVYVPITRKPSARDIAIRHLENVYGTPDRVHWLTRLTNVQKQGSESLGTGSLSQLITDDTRPADAASLAARISSIEDNNESRTALVQEFQAWSKHLNSIFGSASGEDAANKRALLIASALLDGGSIPQVHRTARNFLGNTEDPEVRTILQSPDLKSQFEKIGAEVKGHRVSLDSKRGLARATLRHVWEQQPEIHSHLLNLIKMLTKANESGTEHLEHISELLVDLAVHENDVSLFDVAAEWTDDPNRHDLVIRMLSDAALSESLGSRTHALLLDWAKKNDNQSTVAAHVCGQEFGIRFPRKAMVRLRWALNHEERDATVAAAEESARKLASHSKIFPALWKIIVGWFPKQENPIGTARAFLAVIDPHLDNSALKQILNIAEHNDSVAAEISQGWSLVLSQQKVNKEARTIFEGWIHMIRHDDSTGPYAQKLLDSILRSYLTSDPVSALLYGTPGEKSDADIVEYRRSFMKRNFLNIDR